MKVFLDDERQTPPGWLRTRSYPQTINVLLWSWDFMEIVSLDHDLGNDEEGTGYDVLLWLEEKVVTEGLTKVPQLRVHSANSSARVKMELAIEQINKLVKNNQ